MQANQISLDVSQPDFKFLAEKTVGEECEPELTIKKMTTVANDGKTATFDINTMEASGDYSEPAEVTAPEESSAPPKKNIAIIAIGMKPGKE